VIGHRGARAVAPENTLASLEAAVAAGADIVEFDISPRLQLAHSADEVPRDPVDLDAALDYLRAQGIGLHLDVKLPGYEWEVVQLVRRHRLDDRAIVSTAWAGVTRTFARLAPELPRAIGYPRDRYGVARLPWPGTLTRAGAGSLRAVMPARLPLLLRRARANALALHHTLCSPASVAAAHRVGAPVLAWTANDPTVVRRLASLGIDGIVSDDPGMALATLSAP